MPFIPLDIHFGRCYHMLDGEIEDITLLIRNSFIWDHSKLPNHKFHSATGQWDHLYKAIDHWDAIHAQEPMSKGGEMRERERERTREARRQAQMWSLNRLPYLAFLGPYYGVCSGMLCATQITEMRFCLCI